jgi:hypothetical protein
MHGDLDGSDTASLEWDNGSQERIIRESSFAGFHVKVHKNSRMEVTRSHALPIRPANTSGMESVKCV